MVTAEASVTSADAKIIKQIKVDTRAIFIRVLVVRSHRETA